MNLCFQKDAHSKLTHQINKKTAIQVKKRINNFGL